MTIPCRVVITCITCGELNVCFLFLVVGDNLLPLLHNLNPFSVSDASNVASLKVDHALFVCRLKKVVSNNGRSGADSGNANHDAQISKGLMNVFMKAAQFEAAMTDLITVAQKACTSTETEEQQLTAVFKALGITYDVDKAADVGGTPCFSGPEGAVSML